MEELGLTLQGREDDTTAWEIRKTLHVVADYGWVALGSGGRVSGRGVVL